MTTNDQHDMQLRPWLPGVVKVMLPNLASRTPRERAVLHRLAHDKRMRDVWAQMARLKPQLMSSDDATTAMLGLTYFMAIERRPVGLVGERNRRIEAVGWSRHFNSAASLDDDVLVTHMPDDPVAKRFQLSLSDWFTRTYGGPHLGLVRTITEVALDCHVSRYAARPPRRPSKPKLIRAAGC